MIQFDEKKLEKLHNAGDLLDAKYGKPGSESRRDFVCYGVFFLQWL